MVACLQCSHSSGFPQTFEKALMRLCLVVTTISSEYNPINLYGTETATLAVDDIYTCSFGQIRPRTSPCAYSRNMLVACLQCCHHSPFPYKGIRDLEIQLRSNEILMCKVGQILRKRSCAFASW